MADAGSPPHDSTRLLDLLGRARRRVRAAHPGSPEWEAAEAGVEAIEREIDQAGLGSSGHAADGHAADGRPADDGRTGRPGAAILYFATLSSDGRLAVRGTFVGTPAHADGIRREAFELADRTLTRRELMRELERLAARRGFVLETGARNRDAITFYAWEAES